jgi:hypothetical protein
MRANSKRSPGRRALKLLGGLLLLASLLALAWVASNNRFVDSKPVPVPEALRLGPASLEPERNAFFALLALNAPAGQDPAVEGRRRWASDERPSEAMALKWPSAKQWNCSDDLPSCVAGWRADPEALGAMLSGAANLGGRCEMLASPVLDFEELLPEPKPEIKKTTDQYGARFGALAHFSASGSCLRWLHAKAVLAQLRGDVAATERALQHADTLLAGLLSGSRSLIGHMIAWRAAQRHFHLLTLMAEADAAHTARYAAHLQDLPATVRAGLPWLPAEAHYARVTLRELALGCELADPSAPLGGPSELRCNRSFWFMPEATTQLLDGLWLQLSERARDGGPLALLDGAPQLPPGVFFGHSWRNTVGHKLVAADSDVHASSFDAQADLLLSHAAARLALRAAVDKPADAAAWLTTQELDARLLARLRVDAGAVHARRWRTQAGQPAELSFPIPKTQDT